MDCVQKVIESVEIGKIVGPLEERAGLFQNGFIRGRGTHNCVSN